MEEVKKNQVHIDKVNRIQEAISVQKKELQGSYNNREVSIVITKLQEAEFWLDAYKKSLVE